jgi:hypothetical protein
LPLQEAPLLPVADFTAGEKEPDSYQDIALAVLWGLDPDKPL